MSLTIRRSGGARVRSEAGFTMIQMMVVLAIMGILGSIALYEMRPDYLKGATRQIFSDLQEARMAAVKSRNSASVIFESDRHSYRIEVDEDNDGAVEVTRRDIQTDYRGILFDRAPSLRFNPLGMETLCSFTTACTIRLVRPDEAYTEYRSISVYRTGGMWVED